MVSRARLFRILLPCWGGRVYQLQRRLAEDKKVTVHVKAKRFKPKSQSYVLERYGPLDYDYVFVDLEPEIDQNTQGWAGTWLDESKRSVYTIIDDGGSISGSYRYDFPGTYHANARGNGTFSNCQVVNSQPNCLNCNEYEATCDWIGSHEDDSKTLSQRGQMKFKLTGNRLIATSVHIDNSSTVNWKPGAHQYDPEIAKGYYHSINLVRPKY